jgi:hypothetical protein
MYVRTGAALGIGVLVGGIFYSQPDTQSSADARIHVLLFLMCVFALFCVPAISKCIEDRLLYSREKASGIFLFVCLFVIAMCFARLIAFVLVLC